MKEDSKFKKEAHQEESFEEWERQQPDTRDDDNEKYDLKPDYDDYPFSHRYDDDDDDDFESWEEFEEWRRHHGEGGWYDVYTENAEGFQVSTRVDSEGNVIDVEVVTEEELKAEDDFDCPINSYIDHTLLKPDATVDQIIKLCQEAKEYKFASVCVNSCWVRLCAELLRGSDVSVCCVVGFPLGAMIPEAKAFEAEAAIENGATEIDMVINIGALKSKDYRMVAKDLQEVCSAVHEHDAIVKVIIETCLLTREEKIIACLLAKNAGADFVKTSTGFSTAGATVEDVELMRKVVGETVGVKAAGGIRDRETAERMIEAGADRLGASAGVKICQE